MKVKIFQTSPVLLNLKNNLKEVVTKIREGERDGIALNVFPELALTGYFVGPRYHEVALRLDSPEINKVVSATKGTAAVVGFIEESPSMNFYNSALVAVDGSLLYSYRKLNLPNYGPFEERKFFAPGKKIPVFKLHGFSIAVFICNDLWHPSLPYLGVTQKADIFVTVFNSSQGSMGSEFSNIESWGIINTFYSRIFGIYNVCANRAGVEKVVERRSVPEDLTLENGEMEDLPVTQETKNYRFWGGSEIVNPFGQQVAKAAIHQTDEITGEIHREILRRKKILLPYLRNDDPYFTHRELQKILYKESAPNVDQ